MHIIPTDQLPLPDGTPNPTPKRCIASAIVAAAVVLNIVFLPMAYTAPPEPLQQICFAPVTGSLVVVPCAIVEVSK